MSQIVPSVGEKSGVPEPSSSMIPEDFNLCPACFNHPSLLFKNLVSFFLSSLSPCSSCKSESENIYKLKQKLWTNYKDEYNKIIKVLSSKCLSLDKKNYSYF